MSSYGSFRDENGEVVKFGFHSNVDWLDSIIASFPTPWTIGEETRYGSEIFDGRGKKILSIWITLGNPSEREKGGMSDQEWSEYCCDSHWESETQWYLANAIVAARNALAVGQYLVDERAAELLRILILNFCQWEEPVNDEISCGGPLKRLVSTDKRVPERLRDK